MRRSVVLCALSALLFAADVRAQQAASSASAEGGASVTPAEELVRGARLLEAMDAAAAIAPLERAAHGGAGALAWFNLGLAYRAVGRRLDAIAAWDRYLREPEPAAPEARLDAVRAERAALEAQCPRLSITVTPPLAELSVDERPQRSDGTGTYSILLDVGAHSITARAQGFVTQNQRVELATGERRSVVLALVAEQTVAPPLARAVREEPRPFAPWWTWVGAGVFAAGTSAAIALAVDGGNAYDSCRRDPAWCAANESSIQSSLDARSAGVAVGVSFAVAGLAAAVSGIIVGRLAQPARPSVNRVSSASARPRPSWLEPR
ncbi:MAG: carboxypeptidase regulatory-like domain-containing protein [Myxococcales bacterium]|nr:carboxypeptidase regulatory-like domain-containing protein [Myxococcales bacterium]